MAIKRRVRKEGRKEARKEGREEGREERSPIVKAGKIKISKKN